ncbi:MAG: triose-phosphate isomerase [Bacteroidia bacterium]|nr:triose-phosphate isomerase [Bacteroidia bacterium]
MRKLLAANWKMHLYPHEVQSLLNALIAHWTKRGWTSHPTVIFPPALYLREAVSITQGTPLMIGAQNAFPGEFGAFTGEISMAQIAAVGVQWVLVGHSERRQYFGEKEAFLREKVQDALKRGLRVMYCIGETLAQREAGETLRVLKQQLEEVLKDGMKWDRLAIAYEPVWAIGTGVNATPHQAQEAHAYIRTVLRDLGAPAEAIPILYGGSLKPENSSQLFSQPDVDGGLVGGASLKAESFIAIAEALW